MTGSRKKDSPSSPMKIDGSEDDTILSKSNVLTKKEVLSRRSRYFKQLAQCYKDHYWTLMEELRIKHREYIWYYGKSPYQEDEEEEIEELPNSEQNGENKLGLGHGEGVTLCAMSGCNVKAMALTNYCFAHILADSKQKLYIGCSYPTKSSATGPVLCWKPILRSTVPSYCPIHFQTAEKHVTRALKKAGLNNVSSSNKVAPKFHIVVAEYVRLIQSKRRAAQMASAVKVEIKEENAI